MGGESSADKKDHSVDSQGLKDVIDQELREMKMSNYGATMPEG